MELSQKGKEESTAGGRWVDGRRDAENLPLLGWCPMRCGRQLTVAARPNWPFPLAVEQHSGQSHDILLVSSNSTGSHVAQVLSLGDCLDAPFLLSKPQITRVWPVKCISSLSVPPAPAFRIRNYWILPVDDVCFDWTKLAIVECACWTTSCKL